MPFHIDRFCLSFKKVVGQDPSSVLRIEFSEYKSIKTPARKADFIERLSKHSDGKLNFEGSPIKATYNRCYCGSVSRTKEKIPLTYCYCGADWYKRLFEEVLGRPLRVDVLKSIANGADECVLKIDGVKS